MLNESCLIENNYGRFYGLIKDDFSEITPNEFNKIYYQNEKLDYGYLIGSLEEVNKIRHEYFVNEFSDFDLETSYTDGKRYVLYW